MKLSPRAACVSIALLVAAFVPPAPARAQCQKHWLPGAGVAGLDIYVAAATTWDPDGAGPQPELLVVAGGFQVVGTQNLRGLAGWDGESWREIDPASGGDIYSISALAVYQGDLIVAGSFSTLSGVALNNIARFDGENWHALGLGPANGITGTLGGGWVNTLRVVNDKVIVGGKFDLAGGVSAVNIASWDGATGTWAALGEGLSVGSYYEGVFGIAEHDGEIVAAGDFSQSGIAPLAGIARFDGSVWTGFTPLEHFFPSEVATYEGQLLVGGVSYDPTNPDPNYFGDTIVAAWDDAAADWTPIGGSLGVPSQFGVTRLTTYGGELYAGGDFVEDVFSVDTPGMLLRRWDGQDWQIVGGGISGFTGFQPAVSGFAQYQGELVVAGTFSRAGSLGAVNLAAWDGSAWHAFASGTNSWVRSLVAHAGGIVASGPFDSIEGTTAHRIARWNGASWEPFGDGSLDFPAALGVYQGDLVISQFDLDGRLRRWDGAAWQPFGDGISGGYVTCVHVYRGDLIAGGSFTFIGDDGAEIRNIAAWNGQHWRALGEGVIAEFFGGVNALATYKGKLIVGGAFQTAGGQPASTIASWDGESWESVGGGLTHSEPGVQVMVFALATYEGELYATGQFDLADGVPARDIARWDGHQWRALGPGGATTLYGPGHAFAVVGGSLYVGGNFFMAGGVEVHNVARWDGSTWWALDGGLDPTWFGEVNTLVGYQQTLFAGGSFVHAGEDVSAYLARWGCN